MSAEPIPDPMALPTIRKVIAFAAMGVGFFIAFLDIQIVSASLRDIAGGLSAGTDEAAWVQTSYLIAEIIVIPMSAWMSRVLSTRWLFAASAVGFTLTSLACGLAWNIQSMIVFRALQGFLGGSMIPTVYTTAFVYFSGNQRVIAAAVVGGISALAPTLGPTIGGWITDHYSWHWLFFINLVPGTVVAILVPILVRVDRPDFSLLRGADYLGMALMAVSLGTLEYTLEEGARWNWFSDATIRDTAWIAAISGVGFIWRSMIHPRPVVDLRALAIRNFALGCVLSFVSGIGIFSTIYLTPVFLGEVRGFSALQIGTAVATTGLFQICAIPTYTILARRVDTRILMLFGFLCFAASMYLFTPITSDWGWRQLLLPQAFRGFSQQFALAPVITLSLGSLPPARLRLASGLFNLMRNLGGAIGIAVCATLLNDRTNLHFERLAETLTPANAPMEHLLAVLAHTEALAHGGDPVEGHAAALRLLFEATLRQAQTMTVADAFGAVMLCFLGAALLIPFMRRAGTAPLPADAH